MHCNALVMLYPKDGPLRRSSECIGLRNVVPKRRSLKEFRLFLLLNVCFKYCVGNIKLGQEGEGVGGERGVGEEEEEEEEGGDFKF